MEELVSDVLHVVNPEPDEDGFGPIEFPYGDLLTVHGLDAASYLRANSSFYEGSTMHPHSRVRGDNEVLALLGKSIGVQTDLMLAGLLIFAHSIVEYEDKKERIGDFHYFPPAILTFWAGFECFVRFASTMMVETVRDVPRDVADFLLERKGYRPVLDRYATLLEHGYRYKPDKGARWWQRLEQARNLRDHFTHIRIDTPRGVSTEEVLTFFQDVILALITPSVDLQRSLLLGQYRIYNAVNFLQGKGQSYTERPFFLDWKMERGLHGFHCNFENIDGDRFPNSRDHERIERLSSKE